MKAKRRNTKPKRTVLDKVSAIRLRDNEKIKVHITGPQKGSSGIYRATWQRFKGNLLCERAKCPICRSYDETKESWDTFLTGLVAASEDAFKKVYQEEKEEAPVCGTHLFLKSFEEMGEKTRALILKKVNWSESTWNQYEAFLRRLCRHLDEMHGDFGEESMRRVREALIEETAANGNSKGRQKAEETVDKHLLQFDPLLRRFIDYVNKSAGQQVLPELSLLMLVKIRGGTQFEQLKYIPIPILCRLVKALFEKIENGLVTGVGLMLCFGLRTAEACAVQFGDLEFLDDSIVVYRVCRQGKERGLVLKTENAYRIVFTGKLLYDLLKERMEYLTSLGYTPDQMKTMFVVSKADDPMVPIDGVELSQLARDLLFEAGFQEKDYQLAQRLMLVEKDYEANGTVISSVSAYLFRRNYATLMLNVCGLNDDDMMLDYLLGHKRRKKQLPDVSNPDVIRAYVQKMENIVLNSEHTEHPLYHPSVFEENFKNLELARGTGMAIQVTKDMTLEIEMESCECNGTLHLVVNPADKVKLERMSGSRENLELHNLPLLPVLPWEIEQMTEKEEELNEENEEEDNEEYGSEPVG